MAREAVEQQMTAPGGQTIIGMLPQQAKGTTAHRKIAMSNHPWAAAVKVGADLRVTEDLVAITIVLRKMAE